MARVADIEVKDGWWVVTCSKCILVLTRDQVADALRRGKWWRRRQARAAQETAAARVPQTRRRGT